MNFKNLCLISIFSCCSTINNDLTIMIGSNISNLLKIKLGANTANTFYFQKNINMMFEMEYKYNNLLASISFMPFKKNKLYAIHIKNILTYFTLGIYHEISNYKKIEVCINKKIMENEQNNTPINLKFILGLKLTQKNFIPYIGIELNFSIQLSDQKIMFFEVKGQSDFSYEPKKTIKKNKNLNIPKKSSSPPTKITQKESLNINESTKNFITHLITNLKNSEATSRSEVQTSVSVSRNMSESKNNELSLESKTSIIDESSSNFSDINQSTKTFKSSSLNSNNQTEIPNIEIIHLSTYNNADKTGVNQNLNSFTTNISNETQKKEIKIVVKNIITDKDIHDFFCLCYLIQLEEKPCTLDFFKKQKQLIKMFQEDINGQISDHDIKIYLDTNKANKTEDTQLDINDSCFLIHILQITKINNNLNIFNCINMNSYCNYENLIKKYPIINDIVNKLVIDENKEIFIPILLTGHYLSYYIYKNQNNKLKKIKIDPISIQEDSISCGFVVLYFAKLASENVLKDLCEHENLLENIKEIAIQEAGNNILKYLKKPEKFKYLDQFYQEYKQFFNQDSDLNDIIANIENQTFGSIIRKIIFDLYLTFHDSFSKSN